MIISFALRMAVPKLPASGAATCIGGSLSCPVRKAAAVFTVQLHSVRRVQLVLDFGSGASCITPRHRAGGERSSGAQNTGYEAICQVQRYETGLATSAVERGSKVGRLKMTWKYASCQHTCRQAHARSK